MTVTKPAAIKPAVQRGERSAVWHWLEDPDNRTVLAWLGSGLVVLAAGVWAVFTYLVPPSGSGGGGEAAPRVQVERGVAAGGNISVGRDLNISDPGMPGGKSE